MGVFAFVAQYGIVFGVSRFEWGERGLPALLLGAHLLLLLFLLRNLSFWGVRLILAGLVLNMTVMLANGGLMPVERAAVVAVGRHEIAELSYGEPIPGTKNILLEREDTRAHVLSDIILLPLPHPLTKAVSAGDVLVASGLVLAYVELTLRAVRRREQSNAKLEPTLSKSR